MSVSIKFDKPNAAWFALILIGLLGCYASTLREMAHQWLTDEDMGHGFVVPFISLWIVWRERGKWGALKMKPNTWGFVILLLGAACHLVGSLGAGLFASSVGFLFSVAGIVLCFGGLPLLRSWIFPLVLLLFMLPKLAIVYDQATLPLQLLASRMAAGILTMSGCAVIREGNVLDVGGHRVAVEEACNGIRYLLPLGFLSLVFAYRFDSKVWMRAVLLAVTVPVAIVANAVRVAVSARVPALDSGMLHEIFGLIIFTMCLAAIIPFQRLGNMFYHRYHA